MDDMYYIQAKYKLQLCLSLLFTIALPRKSNLLPNPGLNNHIHHRDSITQESLPGGFFKLLLIAHKIPIPATHRTQLLVSRFVQETSRTQSLRLVIF